MIGIRHPPPFRNGPLPWAHSQRGPAEPVGRPVCPHCRTYTMLSKARPLPIHTAGGVGKAFSFLQSPQKRLSLQTRTAGRPAEPGTSAHSRCPEARGQARLAEHLGSFSTTAPGTHFDQCADSTSLAGDPPGSLSSCPGRLDSDPPVSPLCALRAPWFRSLCSHYSAINIPWRTRG